MRVRPGDSGELLAREKVREAVIKCKRVLFSSQIHILHREVKSICKMFIYKMLCRRAVFHAICAIVPDMVIRAGARRH